MKEIVDEVKGTSSRVIIDWRSSPRGAELRPALVVKDQKGGRIIKVARGVDARYLLSVDAVLSVEPNQKVKAGDVLARLSGNSTGVGAGLRGGSFRAVTDASTIHVALTRVQWTQDLAVSGKIDKPVARTGTVRASLHFAEAGGTAGDINVEWPEGIAVPGAAIRGAVAGAAVVARVPAP